MRVISARYHLSPQSYVSVCHRTSQRTGTERTHTATVNSTALGFHLQDEYSGLGHQQQLLGSAGRAGGEGWGEGNSNPVSACDERSPSLKGPCLCCCPGSRLTTVTAGLLLLQYKVVRSPRAWLAARPPQSSGRNALSPSPPAARPARAGSSPLAAGRLGAQKASGEALRPFSVQGILTRGAPPAPFAGKGVCDAPAAWKQRGTRS